MHHLEIEIKFNLTDIQSVRKRIVEMGAEYVRRVFETNIRFEDAEKSLIQKKSLLRLRQADRATMTFKSQPPDTDDQFKTFREVEVEVSDFSSAKALLESLGFYPEQIYEKWRETYSLGNTLLCLDTMPFGDFLEIEGQKEDIRRIASEIGLKWHRRITHNYLALFEIIRRKLDLPFFDVTFQNLKNIRFDFEKHRRLFEAETGGGD